MEPLPTLLRTRRESLLRRWVDKVRAALPGERVLDEAELINSLRHFLDEVVDSLERRSGQLASGGAQIAGTHGAQREGLHRDVSEVVAEYGLLFAAVVEEAEAQGVPPFAPADYVRLAECLNAGAAAAVGEYSRLRDQEIRRQSWEHFSFLAHEVRNPLQTAQIAARLLRDGRGHGVLAALERSLGQLSGLLDEALTGGRLRGLEAGASLNVEPVDLRKLAEAVVADALPSAEARRVAIRVAGEAASAPLTGDPRLLRSALGNLVRNAVKFTQPGGAVEVRVHEHSVEVEDACGGLAEGSQHRLFEAFRQEGGDRSGYGLGLAIARQAVEAHHGTIGVTNLAGKGCVFVLALPAGR